MSASPSRARARANARESPAVLEDIVFGDAWAVQSVVWNAILGGPYRPPSGEAVYRLCLAVPGDCGLNLYVEAPAALIDAKLSRRNTALKNAIWREAQLSTDDPAAFPARQGAFARTWGRGAPEADTTTFGPDWDQALRRLRAGEIFSHFAGQDGTPSENQWHRRRKSDPGFNDRALEAAQLGGRRKGVRSTAAQMEEFARRVEGGKSIEAVAAMPDMPGSKVFRRWRRLRADLEARVAPVIRMGPWRGYAAPDWDRAVEGIRSGTAMADLFAAGLPSRGALWDERMLNPELDRRVREAIASRAPAALRRVEPSAVPLIAVSEAEILAAVHAATGSILPAIREDVRSEVILEVLDGEATLDQVPARVRAAVTRLLRGETMFSRWGAISVHAPIFDDGSMTVGDRIASDRFHL